MPCGNLVKRSVLSTLSGRMCHLHDQQRVSMSDLRVQRLQRVRYVQVLRLEMFCVHVGFRVSKLHGGQLARRHPVQDLRIHLRNLRRWELVFDVQVGLRFLRGCLQSAGGHLRCRPVLQRHGLHRVCGGLRDVHWRDGLHRLWRGLLPERRCLPSLQCGVLRMHRALEQPVLRL